MEAFYILLINSLLYLQLSVEEMDKEVSQQYVYFPACSFLNKYKLFEKERERKYRTKWVVVLILIIFDGENR